MPSYRSRMQAMADALEFPINLVSNGSVVTVDGEYLGTWGTDETDAIFEFTPDGSSEVTLRETHIGLLCPLIENWIAERQRSTT